MIHPRSQQSVRSRGFSPAFIALPYSLPNTFPVTRLARKQFSAATVYKMLQIVLWALFLLSKYWWEAKEGLTGPAEVQCTREGRDLSKPDLLSIILQAT